jgi:hypothetical protein
MAVVMSRYGGSFANHNNYQVNPINSIVYPVYGGMEE